MASIIEFDLINKEEVARLSALGIRTCAQLLEKASTSIERMHLADRANINDSDLKNLTHHCDLMRVTHMTPALSKALCTIGVCTVPKLAYQNGVSLKKRLDEIDDSYPPRFIEQLVASAKKLPKIIRH